MRATQHSVPRYSDVYFQWRQNVLAQSVGTGRKQKLTGMVMWTRELRHHRHSQILGSPSEYSQRHKGQESAYNVKEIMNAFETVGYTTQND